MVLVGEDVAVPDITTRLVEGRLDAGDLAGQCRDHVLGRIFDVPFRLIYGQTVAIVRLGWVHDPEARLYADLRRHLHSPRHAEGHPTQRPPVLR